MDVQTVLGAIASYLLIGMAFAFRYVTVQAGQTAPFFGDQGAAEVGSSPFFSFTTLTTTGYGSLVPAGDPGQSLAMAEVVPGQLFLVTAVAKVMADYPERPRSRERGDHVPSLDTPDASPRGDDDAMSADGQC